MLSLNEGRYFANLTSEPIASKTSDGSDVVNFRVAINTAGKGQVVEPSTFVDVEAFGGLARLCAIKIGVGSLIFLQAKLKSVDWDGGNKSKLFLRADNIQFLDFLKNDHHGKN